MGSFNGCNYGSDSAFGRRNRAAPSTLDGIGSRDHLGAVEGPENQVHPALPDPDVREVAIPDTAPDRTERAPHTIVAEERNEEQKLRLLPSLASGQGIAAWALTEPGSGSDAAALQTTATERDGTYFLNGSKMFITNAAVAESIVVFATMDRSLGYKGISAFVVDRDSPGLQINPLHGKMGMRSSTTDEVVFQDTPVPSNNLLGEQGRGFNYAMEILDSSRIIIAAQCVGIGQSALEVAMRYAQQRETFGKPIAQHQAIQFMLADMATQVYTARVATMHAATLKDNGLPFVEEASMAKLFASEMCVDVASKAIQVHGGIGYFQEAGVERIFRDARVTTIYEGTSEVQRLLIARQLLAQYPV